MKDMGTQDVTKEPIKDGATSRTELSTLPNPDPHFVRILVVLPSSIPCPALLHWRVHVHLRRACHLNRVCQSTYGKKLNVRPNWRVRMHLRQACHLNRVCESTQGKNNKCQAVSIASLRCQHCRNGLAPGGFRGCSFHTPIHPHSPCSSACLRPLRCTRARSGIPAAWGHTQGGQV